MSTYSKALCWAAAIFAVAVAGLFEVIDESSLASLLVALPVAGWMALRGAGCGLPSRRT